ncbi:hypothetical protein [Paraburkholderia tropica]|uniref:hypothetical protein n=1 Tax=Paraburkholderia tropica TaxID=92647 RepID=UPI002ABE614F|nr:hypothetical protein [Paraburkholderia tropica]
MTTDDITAWVTAVAPAFASNERSLALYVRQWNVPEKVRRAKLQGYFDSTIENARERRAFLLRRFRL